MTSTTLDQQDKQLENVSQSLGLEGEDAVVPPSENDLENESIDKIIVRAQHTSVSLRVTLVNGRLWAACLTKGEFSLLDKTKHWREEDLQEAKEYVMAAAVTKFGADNELTVEDKTKVLEEESAGEGALVPPSEEELKGGDNKIIVKPQGAMFSFRVTQVDSHLWATRVKADGDVSLLDETKHWKEEDVEEAKQYVVAAVIEEFGANAEFIVEDTTKFSEVGEGGIVPPSQEEIDDGDVKIIVRPQVPFTTLRVIQVKGRLWALLQEPDSESLLDNTKHWGEEDLEEAKQYVMAAAVEKFGANHELTVQVMD